MAVKSDSTSPFAKSTVTGTPLDPNLVGALNQSREEHSDAGVSWYEVPLSYFNVDAKRAESLVRNTARKLGHGSRVDLKTEGVVKFAATPPRDAKV